jgi:hypothetical protein
MVFLRSGMAWAARLALIIGVFHVTTHPVGYVVLDRPHVIETEIILDH